VLGLVSKVKGRRKLQAVEAPSHRDEMVVDVVDVSFGAERDQERRTLITSGQG
jgi:hypothetical protein